MDLYESSLSFYPFLLTWNKGRVLRQEKKEKQKRLWHTGWVTILCGYRSVEIHITRLLALWHPFNFWIEVLNWRKRIIRRLDLLLFSVWTSFCTTFIDSHWPSVRTRLIPGLLVGYLFRRNGENLLEGFLSSIKQNSSSVGMGPLPGSFRCLQTLGDTKRSLLVVSKSTHTGVYRRVAHPF